MRVCPFVLQTAEVPVLFSLVSVTLLSQHHHRQLTKRKTQDALVPVITKCTAEHKTTDNSLRSTSQKATSLRVSSYKNASQRLICLRATDSILRGSLLYQVNLPLSPMHNRHLLDQNFSIKSWGTHCLWVWLLQFVHRKITTQSWGVLHLWVHVKRRWSRCFLKSKLNAHRTSILDWDASLIAVL